MESLSVAALAPRDTDRAVLVGQTGCGKTTLAEQLCRLRKYVVILDPKGLIRWKGYQRYTTLAGVVQAGKKFERIIYAPVYEELVSWRERDGIIDTFFGWVYDRFNCTLYVDETSAISTATEWPFWMGACLQRGRERHVETWCATQRPSRIPAIVFSESEHTYIFKLRMGPDRDKVEDMTGVDEKDIRTLAKHQFIYAPEDGEIIGAPSLGEQPLKLTL